MVAKGIMPRSCQTNRAGFTLVELAIVLVIIGLIVGGILVGQTLIQNSELRMTIAQVERYNSAVNTFRTRYNSLPGDLTNGIAQQFGFVARAAVSTAGQGDHNGLIEGGATGLTLADGETVLFWNDMSRANLMDGRYSGTNAPAQTSGTTPVSNFLPPAKLGRGMHFTVYSVSENNYYQLSTITAMDAAGAFTMAPGLSPVHALNIDSKMDDGLPGSGIVIARGGTIMNDVPTAGAAASASCVNSAVTPNIYNTQVDTPLCMQRFRFN